MRAWRRTFDRMAAGALPVAHKDALAAAAATRIDRVARVLAARVRRRCAAPGATSVDRSLADAAEAARCFAGDVAAGYPCERVDLAAFPPVSAVAGGSGHDVRGWTDPRSGTDQGLFVLQPRAAVAETPTRTPTPTPIRTALPAVGSPAITAPSAGQVITTTGVTIAWNPVATATGYDLRILDAGSATVFSGSLTGNGATSTLISLPQSGGYTVRVRACIGGGFSDAQCGPFASRDFAVSIGAPSAAPTVTAPAAGATLTQSNVALQWTAVSGSGSLPLFYDVDLTETGSGEHALQILLPDTALSTVARLHSGAYALRVRACQGGCGPWSATRSFSAAIGSAPGTAPTITNTMVSGNSLAASWTAVGGAEWYQLYVIQPPPAGPGGGALTVAAREVVGTSVGALPIPAGAASVLVAACTGNGCGPFSAPASITGAGPNPSVPQLGQPLGGSVVNGPGVLFTWSRVPGDNGSNTVYRLYVQDLSRATAALDVLTTDNFYARVLQGRGRPLRRAGGGQSGAESGGGTGGRLRGRRRQRDGADAGATDAQLEPHRGQHPARLEPGAGGDALRVLRRRRRLERGADARRDAGTGGAGAAGGVGRRADAVQRHRARLPGGSDLRARQRQPAGARGRTRPVPA